MGRHYDESPHSTRCIADTLTARHVLRNLLTLLSPSRTRERYRSANVDPNSWETPLRKMVALAFIAFCPSAHGIGLPQPISWSGEG